MYKLLIAATELEIKPFFNYDIDVDILITGVGVPNTLYQLQKKLSEKKYGMVIQAGIAGAFTKQFQLADTVIVKEDCFADIGMEEKGEFTPVFETKMADKNALPYKNGWLINEKWIPEQEPLALARAVTINKVSDSKKQKWMLMKKFEPQIETMEGAALHFVCLQENIPFLQLRSISNYVGERNKAKWEMKEAIENLNKELQRVLEPKKA
jgi:futalosine hydrolase